MNDFMDKLKNTKILGIAGNALLLVGTFLPMFSALGISISYVAKGGDGILVFFLAIISLLIVFADKIKSNIPFFEKLTNQKLTLIPSIISAILIIINAFSINSQSGNILGAIIKPTLGFGFYVMVIGLVAAIAYPFVYKGENK